MDAHIDILMHLLQVGYLPCVSQAEHFRHSQSTKILGHIDCLQQSGLLCCAECVDYMQVLEVEQGVCKVRFEGPPPIGMGVQAAIKDKFPDIRNVELVQ